MYAIIVHILNILLVIYELPQGEGGSISRAPYFFGPIVLLAEQWGYKI